MMSNDEIDLWNQVKPGRYNSRKWEVIKRRDGSLDLRYPRATIEHRMELATEAPSLTSMLTKIIAEHKLRAEKRKAGIFEEDEEND